MKTLIGTEKQIKWAEELRNEYLRLVGKFGGEDIDSEDSKFWIENAQVTNITYKSIPIKLEAYNFLRSEKYVDKTQKTLKSQSEKGLITKAAAMMIIQGEVK